MDVRRSAADAGVIPCPCGACDARMRSEPSGSLRSSRRSTYLFLVSQPDVRGHLHYLLGEPVRAPRWPLSPAPAHTHITLTHGRTAHAETNHFTSTVPRGQARLRDDHPPGGAFSYSCASSASRSTNGEWKCSTRTSPYEKLNISSMRG